MKNKSFWYTFAIGIAICVMVVALKLFSIHDLWYETVAAVLSVILTAAVTFLLLKGQSEGEEIRDKNIKIHERKIDVYAKFTSKMWDILSDDNIEASEIKVLRSEIFNELLFFLNDEQIEQIDNALKPLITDQELNVDDCRKSFVKITEILRYDISNLRFEDKADNNVPAASLWSTCSSLCDALAGDSNDIKTDNAQVQGNDSSVEMTKINQERKQVSKRCHHFSIYKFDDIQQHLFAQQTNALFLCEYNGERQRTNAIKRIRLNDIVFAYKSGGAGYVGTFLAKGWVVFERSENGTIKEVKYEYGHNENPRVVEGNEYQSDLKKFRAAELLDEEGEVRFSYLLVEPLCMCDKGVGRISVYRATVSSYDQYYAWLTLARFNYMIEKCENDCGTFNGVQVACNTQKLKALLKEESVPMARIENGEWVV